MPVASRIWYAVVSSLECSFIQISPFLDKVAIACITFASSSSAAVVTTSSHKLGPGIKPAGMGEELFGKSSDDISVHHRRYLPTVFNDTIEPIDYADKANRGQT